MKRLFLSVAILSISVSAFAWEKPQNPDRFPSLGIALEGDSAQGTTDLSTGQSQDFTGVSSSFAIDTRLPLSNSFTLTIGLGAGGIQQDAKANAFFTSAKTSTHTGTFVIAGRYYFNR